MQKPFVLIVEDETDIAELIAINLKHNGFDCAIANNSTEAQAIVYERPTDLVLLDWMLPNMSGMALANGGPSRRTASGQRWPSAWTPSTSRLR